MPEVVTNASERVRIMPVAPEGPKPSPAAGSEVDGTLAGGTLPRMPAPALAGQSEPAAGSEVVRPDAVPETMEEFDIGTCVSRLKKAMRFVSRNLIGRNELVAQSVYALLTREHQLIYARAGTAKSLFAESVFSAFKDGQHFSVQLTKGTPEEALVGAVNIEELKRGNMVHNTEGSITRANFAFLDELFDANDVALRSLLGVLNERVFRKGKQLEKCPLHTAIATTNYLRQSEITEAVVDRFLYRSTLEAKASQYDQLQIDHVYAQSAGSSMGVPEHLKLSMDEITFLNRVIEGKTDTKVTAAPHVLFMKNMLIATYEKVVNEEREKEGKSPIYVSPRTIAKSTEVLSAAALLQGRLTVDAQDLSQLRYTITTLGDKQQERAFTRARKHVQNTIDQHDRNDVDYLMHAHQLIKEVVNRLEHGAQPTPSLFQRLKTFFGFTDPADFSFEKIAEVVSHLRPKNEVVKGIQADILERIHSESRMLGKKQASDLNALQ